MDAEKWVDANRHLFGSDYERLFALTVLPLVQGLEWGDVKAQYPFLDKEGRQRYSDFVILESENVRLAIEVDGYDKKGDGTGMSHADFVDWQRRQASLASQGWHVLRFANRDVRDYPESCAEHITELLTKLRMNEGGRVQIVTVHSQKHETPSTPGSSIEPTRTRGIFMPSSSAIALGLISMVAVASWWLYPSKGSVSAVEPTMRASVDVPAPKNISTPQPEIADENDQSYYGNLDCKNPIKWHKASEHVGKFITVAGPLVESKASPNLGGKPIWLNIGNKFPERNRFSVVIWGVNWGNFNLSALGINERGGTVSDFGEEPWICVAGVITSYKGVPQIEIQSPSQVRMWHAD